MRGEKTPAAKQCGVTMIGIKGEGMEGFFANTRPGTRARHGKAGFDLPILYMRDDLFGLYFSADTRRVREIMPSRKMNPVTLPGGRAIIAIMAFNYVDTTIGPYGELAVAIPALYDRSSLPGLGFLPALMQGSYPGFGVLVQHLPVTTIEARDAGRGVWGYTKFIADMDFTITPEYQECRLSEGEGRILELRVMRRGFCLSDRRPLVTFSVRNGALIRTVIPQKGVMRLSLDTRGSFVRFGEHPVAATITALGIAGRPFMACYYTERAAILPKGEIVEEGVRPLDGYRGKDRRARHTVEYTGFGF